VRSADMRIAHGGASHSAQTYFSSFSGRIAATKDQEISPGNRQHAGDTAADRPRGPISICRRCRQAWAVSCPGNGAATQSVARRQFRPQGGMQRSCSRPGRRNCLLMAPEGRKAAPEGHKRRRLPRIPGHAAATAAARRRIRTTMRSIGGEFSRLSAAYCGGGAE